MFLGEGANGKSTLLSLFSALLGAENVSAVALHRLDEDRFSAAGLEGKFENIFADLDSRALQASSMFKAITGGDAITGERKFKPPFSFHPYARLLYSANHPPPTTDSSDGFFRRWLIVPFDRRFDGDKADRHILDRLAAASELSGLLLRGLRGLPELRKRGAFMATDATETAAQRFRVDADSVAGFFEDACEFEDGARVAQKHLFARYREWCQDSNRRPLGKQNFNARVAAHGIEKTTYNGTRCWLGLKVEDSEYVAGQFS